MNGPLSGSFGSPKIFANWVQFEIRIGVLTGPPGARPTNAAIDVLDALDRLVRGRDLLDVDAGSQVRGHVTPSLGGSCSLLNSLRSRSRTGAETRRGWSAPGSSTSIASSSRAQRIDLRLRGGPRTRSPSSRDDPLSRSSTTTSGRRRAPPRRCALGPVLLTDHLAARPRAARAHPQTHDRVRGSRAARAAAASSPSSQPLRSPASAARERGQPFGHLRCPFGHPRLRGGFAAAELEVEPRAGHLDVRVAASRPSRVRATTRARPGGTRSKRNRPSASVEANRPELRQRDPRVGRRARRPCRRRVPPKRCISTTVAGGRPSMLRADRLRPHLRAALERDAGLDRERHDVVERRLVLAADGGPEVGLRRPSPGRPAALIASGWRPFGEPAVEQVRGQLREREEDAEHLREQPVLVLDRLRPRGDRVGALHDASAAGSRRARRRRARASSRSGAASSDSRRS